MAKDPAFLFYSKDFYEGTRTMLPEERACYVDLMIYQHQNGYIPKDDIKRVLLYCNGIKKATLEATLKAKFTLTDKGWVNSKLSDIVQEREEYSQKQSLNGQIGQFWKKMKAFLSKNSYDQLRDALYGLSNEEVYNIIKDKDINKTNAQAMLEAVLKHLANADANAIIIIDSIGGVGEKESFIPVEDYELYSFEEFWNDYDKKVGDKSKIEKKYNALPIKTKESIKEYLPKYKKAQPNKKYRKNPETFLNNKSWNDEIIEEDKVITQRKGTSLSDMQQILDEHSKAQLYGSN